MATLPFSIGGDLDFGARGKIDGENKPVKKIDTVSMASSSSVADSDTHQQFLGGIKTDTPSIKLDAEIRLTEEEWINRYNTDFHVTFMVTEGLDIAPLRSCASEIIPGGDGVQVWSSGLYSSATGSSRTATAMSRAPPPFAHDAKCSLTSKYFMVADVSRIHSSAEQIARVTGDAPADIEVVFDSGATSTLDGELWFINHGWGVNSDNGLHQRPNKRFRFGDSRAFGSLGVLTTQVAIPTSDIPGNINNTRFNICTDIIDGDIPLLISRPAMSRLKCSINFRNNRLEFGNRRFFLLELNRSGHLITRITKTADCQTQTPDRI